MTSPVVPGPLNFLVEVAIAGTVVYRVHPGDRDGNAFNPGYGPRTRFAFFGDPVVPVLYAGQSAEAAVFESIFHDTVPGSVVPALEWRPKVLSVLVTRRDLRLAQFHSDGLRRLDIHARDVTDTPASAYPHTVRWAQAAHAAGCDGLVWMSRQFNTDRAYVFFGDRVTYEDLEVLHGHPGTRSFALPVDEEWVAALADRIGVSLSFASGP